MQTRIFLLFLIMLLALPTAAIMPPVVAGSQLQPPTTTMVAAKKNKKNKAKYRTVRRLVTRTFTNSSAITINTVNAANPYPSTITVTGFKNGTITDVNLLLNGFSHTHPEDVDILLYPDFLPGQNAIVLSDVGDAPDVTNIALVLDDQAGVALSEMGPLVSGTFQPTNIDSGDNDSFHAQAPSGNSLLSSFNGSNPNGSWQLFVRDDFGNVNGGSLSSGWALQITAEADVKIKKDKKKEKGKKGKGRR